MTTLAITFIDTRPHCDECYSPANIILLFSRQHVCGRACLKRSQEQEAKVIAQLEKDSA